MPANRSRTENWKHCLNQIATRGGSLELAVKVDHLLNPGGDLIWRVRLLSLGDKELVVEHPAAVGRSFKLNLNTELVVGMTIGQNRWMFATRVIGARTVRLPTGRETAGLIVALPEKVERCSRRQFYRVPTAEFNLPMVECWPLIDPSTVVPAETNNRQLIQQLMMGNTAGATASSTGVEQSNALPSVGPKFHARLLNISGGGLGLLFDCQHQGLMERHPYLWLRVNLQPQIPAPLALTARRAHTHMDAAQSLYGGFAFDFTFHPQHQRFVVDLFSRYVELVEQHQRQQRASQAA